MTDLVTGKTIDEAREIIKGKVLENAPAFAREVAEELASATNSDVVQVIGTKFVLYRKNKKNPKKKKNNSWIKKILMFVLQVIAGWAIESFLNRLVALIIKIFTNGSFYFYNRMFYFGENYG